MSLYLQTLAAILSLASAPAVVLPDDHRRLEALAADIVHVVEQHDVVSGWLDEPPLPFRGPHRRLASVMALVAINHHESRFRADVADCRVVGSDFPSITGYQLLGHFAFGPYSPRELCRSGRLAAERSLAVMAFHAARCGTPGAMFRGYASGDCGKHTEAARARCKTWMRLTMKAGLVTECGILEIRTAR